MRMTFYSARIQWLLSDIALDLKYVLHKFVYNLKISLKSDLLTWYDVNQRTPFVRF